MTGTEGIVGTPQTEVSLALRMQIPMVIPKEIKDLELFGQLPKGDIAYIDVSEPDTIRFVDQETWHPITKGGIEKRTNFEHAPKRFAAIIVHTPPRTPENSYTENIHQVSSLLRRHVSKDEAGATTGQDLGTLFIVEDKGEDVRVGWRQRQLAQEGLVIDPKHNKSIITTDQHIITFARRRKQHPAVNLYQGRSGYMIGPFTEETRVRAESLGLSADTTKSEHDARATRNPRRVINALRDGEAELTGMDEDGHPIIVSTDKSGVTTVLNEEGLRKLTEKQAQNLKLPKVEHKAGDKVTREDLTCDTCGNHPQDIYRRKPGKTNWLLIKETICNTGKHRDGRERRFGNSQFIKALERLPRDQQKPRKTPKK